MNGFFGAELSFLVFRTNFNSHKL